MTKTVRVQDDKLQQALEAGADYLVVGDRRLLLVEVSEGDGEEVYSVTDPREVQVMNEAMQDKSRRLCGPEAREYLRNHLSEYSVR